MEYKFRRANSIGFIWDTIEITWDKQFDKHFNRLCAFKAENGHFITMGQRAKNVIQEKFLEISTLYDEHKSLGNWVMNQRASYKKNALNSDRIQKLNSIGFISYGMFKRNIHGIRGLMSSVHSKRKMGIVMCLHMTNETDLWVYGLVCKDRGIQISTSYVHSKHKVDIVMHLKTMNETNLWDFY
uniref:Helicase-associated domain-containing protein n=1 Tax=Ditylum brightwellii TaxID=49249 RepID=A0A7S4V3U2_9STRA